MRSDILSGGRLADCELPDHTNVPGRLSAPGDDPLILGWDNRPAAAMAARL